MYFQFLLCALGCILILFSTFWFRQPQRHLSEAKRFREPLYSEIVLLFLDATGYRYITGTDQDHQIFQSITLLKQLATELPNNTFLHKTKAVPPSTDFTILSIINGVKQMHNNLDIIFKSYPAPYEDSILRKQFKSALYSSKKQDWLRMTSGDFTYIENPKFFTLENILIADMSSYQFFKEAVSKPTPDYQLYVTHLMGFDALGHAIQYQNYDKGMELLKLFNSIIDGVLTNLKMSQLLIIIGDHDQSKRGKHYQCSMESYECEGFIFAFSKKGLNVNSEIFDVYEPTDLSATIAALLGFAPTSQNMGKIIPQLYPDKIDQTLIKQDQELIKEQMLKYLKQQNHKISQSFIEEMENLSASKAIYEIQRNFQVGLANKYLFSLGLILIIISVTSYFKLWGYEELIVLTVVSIMESSVVMVILGGFLLLRKTDLKFQKIITIISGLLFILLFNKGYINNFLLTFEIQFLIILIIKYLQLRQISPIVNWKQLILIFLTIFSQTLVYLFFIVDESEFELKRYFLFTLFGALVLLCFVDPRIFNKGKIKSLYVTMLYIFSDAIVIIQLNDKQSFIQFILYFLLLNNECSSQNLIIAKIIYSIINPIKMQHQVFQNHYQINMNSMIILTKEFDIGPSLISVFIGCFGLQLIGIASIFFKKHTESIKVLTALIFSQVISLLLVSFKILNFSQSLDNSDEKIEQQISLIYNLPLQLVELLLFSLTLILVTRKKET